MTSAFIAKLEHGSTLTSEDRQFLSDLTSVSRRVEGGEDIISEGDLPENVHLVLEGFACRYKVLAGGERQIMALLIPGDFCDLHVAILGAMDHSIGTLSACTMVEIPRSVINDITQNQPRITRALWWASLVDEAVLREWLVSMGGRPADQQLAHFFCEMLVRLQVTGYADDYSYELPLTQVDLGDVLGLSTVHINRSLQKLRGLGLIRLRSQRLTVLDLEGLNRFAEFNPNYLHLKDSLFPNHRPKRTQPPIVSFESA